MEAPKVRLLCQKQRQWRKGKERKRKRYRKAASYVTEDTKGAIREKRKSVHEPGGQRREVLAAKKKESETTNKKESEVNTIPLHYIGMKKNIQGRTNDAVAGSYQMGQRKTTEKGPKKAPHLLTTFSESKNGLALPSRHPAKRYKLAGNNFPTKAKARPAGREGKAKRNSVK